MTPRPRGRPRLTPAPAQHSWHRVHDETSRERHACRHCGARHGAWLAQWERAHATASAGIGDLPRRADPDGPCPGEPWTGDRYVLPTGGSTADRARAESAWRRHLDVPRTVGRPPGPAVVALGIRVAPDVAAWLRAQPEGPSAAVERVVRARPRREECPACGGVGYDVGSDGEREDCVRCDPRRTTPAATAPARPARPPEP